MDRKLFRSLALAIKRLFVPKMQVSYMLKIPLSEASIKSEGFQEVCVYWELDLMILVGLFQLEIL